MKNQTKSVTAHKMIHASKRVNPCAFVREYLAKSFKTTRRCDAIRYLESKGVATHTARTQYQKYFAKVNAPKVTKGRKVAKSKPRKVNKPATVTAPVAVAA